MLSFAKIDDKKISGSDVAGYYGEQTVFSNRLLQLLSDCKLNKVIGGINGLPTSSFPIHNRLSGARACDMRVPSLRLQFVAQTLFQPLER